MDCLKGMKLVDNKTIDIIVTSPPYNLGKKYDTYVDKLEEKKYFDWLSVVATEFMRVLKDDGSIFLNVGGTAKNPLFPVNVVKEFTSLFNLQNVVHWVKSITVYGNSIGHYKPLNSDRFLSNLYEYVFHLTKSGDVRLDKTPIGVRYKDETNIRRKKSTSRVRDRGNVWFIPYKTTQKRRSHIAVFPRKLPDLCIKLHGIKSNTLVLDPFMGSGTTALACIDNNVNFIGFDISKGYCIMSQRAIENMTKKTKFDEWF